MQNDKHSILIFWADLFMFCGYLWNKEPQADVSKFVQEIKVLSNLKHPNIVQYYGSEIVCNFLHKDPLWA